MYHVSVQGVDEHMINYIIIIIIIISNKFWGNPDIRPTSSSYVIFIFYFF